MLKDKVIIVTGAGSGIGLATAQLLAQAGAKVVVSGRENDRLSDAVDDIRQGGGAAIAVAADVFKRCCQSNDNLSPLGRRWGRGGGAQSMRDRHSARAAARLAL